MTIGIEAERANNPSKTGVEHYTKQLILALAKLDKQNKYTLYLRTRPEKWFLSLPENFQVKVMPFPIFWTQLRLSWEMFVNPVDVLFIPASAIPFYHPKNTVVTIHDVGWRYFPESFTWFMRNFLEFFSRTAIKKSSKIIAVSSATKKDILKFYPCPPEKIAVVYHGVDEELKAEKREVFEEKSVLPKKYVLFLSTLQPRKNLERLIEAFRILKRENPDLPHKLVVIGKPGWKYEGILRKIEENKDIVLYLGYASDRLRLYALLNAEMLVQPSLYEGFGMQVLEALAVLVPVVASSVSSLPEVLGDAAVYFDPTSPTDMKNAIKNLIDDMGLRHRLQELGKERLKFFSWEKCAQETLKVLTNV